MTEKILGLALVGLGKYSAEELAPALRLTRRCRLAGVVTSDRAKGERWAAEFGFSPRHVYTDATFSRLADNPAIDLVYVVTPNARHASDVQRAAAAGKHVLCEKPFTTSVPEAEAAIGACRAAGVKLSIGYRLHFDPYHQELLRLAQERDFGRFHRMEGEFSFVLPAGAWRAERKWAGGGPIMDIGLYVIQAACIAAGGVAPIAVTAQEEAKRRPEVFPDVEEGMTWNFEFAGGATLEAASSYARQRDFFRAEGPGGWIEFRRQAFMYRGLEVVTSRGPLHYPPVNQQALQMDNFADCIMAGRESRVPGEMGLRDLKIITALYQAARTGRRTPIVA